MSPRSPARSHRRGRAHRPAIPRPRQARGPRNPAQASATMNSAARSPIMIDGAFVLPVVTIGMIGGVGHAQALDAVHAEPRIDDGGCIRTQLARSDLVVVGDRGLAHVGAHGVRGVDSPAPGTARRHPSRRARSVAPMRRTRSTAATRLFEVGLAGEDVRVERDRILGRRAGEAQRASALRPHHAAEQREAVLRPLHPRLVHRDHEVDRLDVGHGQPRPRAPEKMRLASGQPG